MTGQRTISAETAAPKTIQLDLLDRNIKGRTSGYLLEGDKPAIIEPGPGPSGELWMELLASRGYSPEDLAYVIVTHLHLDHAGAAGFIMQKCPKAKAVVHPKGARFLVNPTPLLEGSKAFYDDFEKFMLPVYPIDENRVIPAQDGEVIDCGSRKLTILHGEGHSRSHFVIRDTLTKGVFSGDAAGLTYPELKQRKIVFCLPATVPNQFDPSAYRVSLEKIRELKPEMIFHTHFGAISQPEEYFDVCGEMLDLLIKTAEEMFSGSQDLSWQALERVLQDRTKQYLVKKSFPAEQPLPELVLIDLKINAQGLADWWSRKLKGKA